MAVYLPLNGPESFDAKGKLKPAKAPAVLKWQAEGYVGVDRNYGGWVGLRTDDLVIVDCDNDAAVETWRSIGAPTFEVKTPRGRHFYYKHTPGSPTAPAVGVLDDIDIRAGRTSQVVVPPTPGYEEVGGEIAPFVPSWIPKREAPESFDQGWDTIPEGRRNVTLTAIGGSLRKQGAGAEMIAATLATINSRRCVPPIPDDEVVTIVRSVMRYDADPFESDGDIIIVGEDGEEVRNPNWRKISMSDMILPPPPEWFWKPYLPKGRLVLLDGGEGIGKGLFCVWAACKITSGEWGDEPKKVLWFAAEDDPTEDIQRRLLAAGYEKGVNAEVDFIEGLPRFPRDLVELVAELKAEDYGLIILDPGRSFLGPDAEYNGPWSYNDEAAVRPGLEQLNRLAKWGNITILFVHHWNKNSAASIEDRSAGSKAFRQVVRHVISMAWVGDTDLGEGALAVTKSNIGPTGALRGYSLEAVPEWDSVEWMPGDTLPDNRMSDFIKRIGDEQEGEVAITFDLDSVLGYYGPALMPGMLFPSVDELYNRFRAHGMTKVQAKEIRAEAVREGLASPRGKGELLYAPRALGAPHDTRAGGADSEAQVAIEAGGVRP